MCFNLVTKISTLALLLHRIVTEKARDSITASLALALFVNFLARDILVFFSVYLRAQRINIII